MGRRLEKNYLQIFHLFFGLFQDHLNVKHKKITKLKTMSEILSALSSAEKSLNINLFILLQCFAKFADDKTTDKAATMSIC